MCITWNIGVDLITFLGLKYYQFFKRNYKALKYTDRSGRFNHWASTGSSQFARYKNLSRIVVVVDLQR